MNILKKLFRCHCKADEPQKEAVADNAEENAPDAEVGNVSLDDTVEQTSLLDNAAYMSLAEQCCQMHDELDMMAKQVKDSTIIDFITMQKSRIRETLVISGATMIDEGKSFNRLRHQPVPPAVIANDTPIAETLEAGVEIGDRVMIKAKVRI